MKVLWKSLAEAMSDLGSIDETEELSFENGLPLPELCSSAEILVIPHSFHFIFFHKTLAFLLFITTFNQFCFFQLRFVFIFFFLSSSFSPLPSCTPTDFWNRENYPLTRDEYGVWHIFLPDRENGQPAIAHNSKVKLHLILADGSHADRVPAWIKVARQVSSTINFFLSFNFFFFFIS
jgi:hypothetical protein